MMQMQNPRAKRRELILRVLTYILMTTAVVGGVFLCLAYAMGWRFDFSTREVSQVALLQFGTWPTGATVELDGKKQLARTPTRANVTAGRHTIKYTLSGYRPWTATVEVKATQVRWLNYARLIPNTITTDTLNSWPDFVAALPSPDHKYLVVQNYANRRGSMSLSDWLALAANDNTTTDGQTTSDDTALNAILHTATSYYAQNFSLSLLNLSDPTQPKTETWPVAANLVTPPDDLTNPTQTDSEKFAMLSWDSSSRYLLVRHDVNQLSEYLMLDRTKPSGGANLTREFAVSLTDPVFADGSGKVFYALTPGTAGDGQVLRRFDLGNKSVSTPIASHVLSFQLSGDNIALVTESTVSGQTVRQVQLYHNGRTTTEVSFALSDDSARDQVTAHLATYNKRDYLAVTHGSDLIIVPDPQDTTQQTFTTLATTVELGFTPSWLSLSPNSQYFAMGRDNKIVTFDLDTKLSYHWTQRGDTEPTWLDDANLVICADGQIDLAEFDGGNRATIVSGCGPAWLSPDEKYLFSLDETAAGHFLQRSNMTVSK